MRRGPVAPALLAALQGSPVRACEDGGAVAARALEVGEVSFASALDAGDEAERREARAYVETTDLVEGLGASGSAAALTAALLRRLEERTP
jgi:hypothetical protein